jgi:hypothetical protein
VHTGWLTDKDLALRMLQWIMAFAVAGRDQLRHTHVSPAPPCLLTGFCCVGADGKAVVLTGSGGDGRSAACGRYAAVGGRTFQAQVCRLANDTDHSKGAGDMEW